MEKDLYLTHYQIQKKHWWFVVKTKIILDTIRKYLAPKENRKILDIGCGAGLMLSSLTEVGETFGMDMSDDAIEFCRKNFAGTIKKGFLPDGIPYEKDFFDLVVALDVIEHVDNDVEALAAMRNLLNATGKAVITVPAYMFLWSEHDDLNQHKRRYSLGELRDKLTKSGFTIEKISYFNTFLFPVIYVIRKLNNILKRRGGSDFDMPGTTVNYALKQIFGFEKYLLRLFNLPFGVSILAVVRK